MPDGDQGSRDPAGRPRRLPRLQLPHEQARPSRAARTVNSVPGRWNRSGRTGPRPIGHIVPK
jgi:hypothetical protein